MFPYGRIHAYPIHFSPTPNPLSDRIQNGNVTFSAGAGKAQARAGRLSTGHGEVLTPAFMPVGTQGAVKAVTPAQLRESGTQIVLGNTYHLSLRPGDALIESLGGLHRFMAWDGPILTDSGGFQVFSLATSRKITEDGVSFQSHIDGQRLFLSPERCMEIQRNLGADVVMALDECPPAGLGRSEMELSVSRTTRWLKRCRDCQLEGHQGLFAINQGGTHLDLRRRHLEEILEIDAKTPFQGFAIGGLSVGEPKEEMNAVLTELVRELPADRPRYLMGVGAPEDILFGIEQGVDLFDCVLPTREARHGRLLTSRGRINIRNARHRSSDEPPDPDCACYTCRTFSRAYLHHLSAAGELLGLTLNTVHNLGYTIGLTRAARAAVVDGALPDFAKATRRFWETEDQ